MDMMIEEIETIRNSIASVLDVDREAISDVVRMKKGMTNSSYSFHFDGQKYIFRDPGKGTDKLINRKQEYEVYSVIKEYDICDDLVYIDPNSGYKITRYYDSARVCDPYAIEDVKSCMNKLRYFHNLDLKVSHSFDLFAQIDYYEKLRNKESEYPDYYDVKVQVFKLKNYIDEQPKNWCLAHIDAVPDNFLFTKQHGVRLIDWEYSGMQDGDVDLAMFCIYSEYNLDKIHELIDIYYAENCEFSRRIKILCYIAACGLLWSNWCEYKHSLGIVFGDYAVSQFNYAKVFSRLAQEQISGMGL